MIIKKIIGLSAIVTIMVFLAIEVYYYISYQELLKKIFDTEIVNIVTNINNNPFNPKNNTSYSVSICIDLPLFQNRDAINEKIQNVSNLDLPYAVVVYLNKDCSDLFHKNSKNILIQINSPRKKGITTYEFKTDIIFEDGQKLSLYYICTITTNGWELLDINPKVLS